MEGFSNESDSAVAEEEKITPITHLAEGFKPIVTCVGTEEDFGNSITPVRERFEDVDTLTQDVNFYATTTRMNKEGSLHDGRKSYVLSVLDNVDKMSTHFYNCVGVVVAGIDKETGEEVSLMGHQNTAAAQDENMRVKFVEDLHQRFGEMEQKCVPGSVDVVLFGGMYTKQNGDPNAAIGKEYIDLTGLLMAEFREKFGFTPMVVNGPKHGHIKTGEYDSAYYINEGRKLFLVRPHVNPHLIADEGK